MTRFIDNKDGTITDNKTGRMWENTDPNNTYSFEETKKYIKELSDCTEYDDWRLPTTQELISIIDYSRSEPAIDPIFKCRSSRYWSGTVYESFGGNAWDVYFDTGVVYYYYEGDDGYVRCVRSEPEKIIKRRNTNE